MKKKELYPFVTEAEPWFSHLRNRGRSEKTIMSLRTSLLFLAKYLDRTAGTTRFHGVTQQQLEIWKNSLLGADLKMSSIAVFVRAARGYFGWLFDGGLIFANPAEQLHMPRYTRPMQYVPTEAVMDRLFKSIRGRSPCDLRDRALFEVAYSTGFRTAELAAMTVDSVDLVHGTVRGLTKGRRERVLPLTQAAVVSLKAYLAKARPVLAARGSSCPAMWLREHGGRLACSAIQDTARRRGREIGVPLTIHSVRRAFATHLMLNGASVAEVKELLGHSSYQHMQHYIRYAPEELRAIHRRSKLGR